MRTGQVSVRVAAALLVLAAVTAILAALGISNAATTSTTIR
jgi:hypothetical protein